MIVVCPIRYRAQRSAGSKNIGCCKHRHECNETSIRSSVCTAVVRGVHGEGRRGGGGYNGGGHHGGHGGHGGHHGGHHGHGHGYWGGYYGGYWPYYAAWGWPLYWGAAWGYPYYDYAYPYYQEPLVYREPYPVYPQGAIAPPPTTQVPQGSGGPSRAPLYQNYCESARAYFPQVTVCPEGWRLAAPG